jgi:PHO85 cyclin-1
MVAYEVEMSLSIMIRYLARRAVEVVPNVKGQPPDGIPSIRRFIKAVVRGSNAPIPTLITSLVYMRRLQVLLPPDAFGIYSTPYWVFFAALIIAAKNCNDVSPWNSEWSQFSMMKDYNCFSFPLHETNLMEKQFLQLLDWNVMIEPEDLQRELEMMQVFICNRQVYGRPI